MLVASSRPLLDTPDLYYIISVTNGPEISIHLSFQFVLLHLVNQYNPELSCIYIVIFVNIFIPRLLLLLLLIIPMYNTL